MTTAPALPDGVEQAFQVAAGELGMASASWLFVREVTAVGGDELVHALRDQLGRAFPVLDAVALSWLNGARAPITQTDEVLAACRGADHLLIVGLEADFLDALIPHLGPMRIALLQRSPFDVDWKRVVANYAPRVELLDLDHFQLFAGPRSVLLTFAYGVDQFHAQVLPGWKRVIGEDVRAQFRDIVAWDVLRSPMFVFPRWLVETPRGGFTHLISP